MERNWDLIREILRILAEKDDYDKKFGLTHFTNNLPKELSNEGLVKYHLDMMMEAGFILGKIEKTNCGSVYDIDVMTYYGQDLWAMIKEKNLWEEIKECSKKNKRELTIYIIEKIYKFLTEKINNK